MHDARAAVGAFARHAFPPDALERIALLTSEIATNAIMHAAPPIWIDAHLDGRGLRVEAHDASPELVHVRRPPARATPGAPLEIGGWGLVLVDELADAWGCHRAPHGKVVWFEVDYPAPQVGHERDATNRPGDPRGG